MPWIKPVKQLQTWNWSGRFPIYQGTLSYSISNNDVDDESAKIVICLFNVNLRERESQKSTHPEIENNTNHYVAFFENDVESAWHLSRLKRGDTSWKMCFGSKTGIFVLIFLLNCLFWLDGLVVGSQFESMCYGLAFNNCS